MNTILKHFRTVSLSSLFLSWVMMVFAQCTSDAQPRDVPNKKQKIKIALLLDTSNSMDGLIDQAKAQLWNLVNELAKATCDNDQKPEVEIALYEYGNSRLSVASGYIRKVSPFTTQLDDVSAALFSLSTNGGEEYCGQVIQTCLNELSWNADGDDLQVIFIAGNEPFTQGPVDFRSACAKAKQKNIVVNTIFCGNFEEGISTQWKAGADLTNGKYMSIQQDKKTVYLETPFDDKITQLNERLNDTYIYYGQEGKTKKQNQEVQDSNSKSYGKGNEVNRVISKSHHVYKNSTWDIVDGYSEQKVDLKTVDKSTMPQQYQQMSDEDLKKEIERKKAERAAIQTEIAKLSEKRTVYIQEKTKNEKKEGMLDDVMLNAVKQQAKEKKMKFEK